MKNCIIYIHNLNLLTGKSDKKHINAGASGYPSTATSDSGRTTTETTPTTTKPTITQTTTTTKTTTTSHTNLGVTGESKYFIKLVESS